MTYSHPNWRAFALSSVQNSEAVSTDVRQMADAFKKIYFATIRMAHFTKPLKWVAIQKCLVNPALQIADPWTFLTPFSAAWSWQPMLIWNKLTTILENTIAWSRITFWNGREMRDERGRKMTSVDYNGKITSKRRKMHREKPESINHRN